MKTARRPGKPQPRTSGPHLGDVAARHKSLLDWYRRSRRDLPWRRSRDAYEIWVSEVMLQQTTVRAATSYYVAFLKKFPDVRALARASDDDVLAAWSGLGYYHRARNLARGARHLVAHHGGAFPRSWAAALAVPGVGLYTAAAVLSIAYGEAHAVVDGNVKRVLARFFGLRGERWRKEGAFHNLAAELLQREAAGDWNQALMELGATICSPRRPACAVCPWRGACVARARGLQDVLPEPAARRRTIQVSVAAALVRRGPAVLFARRGEGKLLARLWEIPQTSLESGGRADLVHEVRERYGLSIRLGPLVARARHTITFRRIELEAYAASVGGPVPEDSERFRFVDPRDLGSIGTSSMSRKILRSVQQAQLPLTLG